MLLLLSCALYTRCHHAIAIGYQSSIVRNGRCTGTKTLIFLHGLEMNSAARDTSVHSWDVFFAAVMLGLAGPDHASSLRARDIAYANIITTVYSRTVTGMVPNYRSGQGGQTCTYDRTEPMVGSWSLQILHSVFDDAWPVQLLWPALEEWNRFVRMCLVCLYSQLLYAPSLLSIVSY